MTHWNLVGLAVAGVILLPGGAGGLRAEQPLAALLNPYFRVHAALSADTTDGVKADAALIEQAAAGSGAAAQPVAEAARALGEAGDLAAARTAFGTLSRALTAYAERAGSPLGDDVRTMYCSMAQQSWLQKGEQIRNPYYGKSMLTCGEIKKRAK